MAHAGQPGFARKHARRSAHAAGPISAVLPDTPHTMRADRSRQGIWVEKRRPGPERIGQALADPIRIGSRLCGMLGTKRRCGGGSGIVAHPGRHAGEDATMTWFVLAIAIVAEVIATTALKASDGFTRLYPSAINTETQT